MGSKQSTEIAALVRKTQAGDLGARAVLCDQVYKELRAEAHFRYQLPGATLQHTEFVHDAIIRLMGTKSGLEDITSLRHFRVIAGRTLCRLVQDYYRKKSREKHGAALTRAPLDANDIPDKDEELMAFLYDALVELEQMDKEMHDLVVLRYFRCLTIPETAETLGTTVYKVNQLWAEARAVFRVLLSDHAAQERI